MNKRILLLFIVFTFCVLSVNSQVAINTSGATPEDCAILDISSSTKGLLIPRMNLTSLDDQMSPIEAPVEGLLIYNIGNADGIEKGLYYWSEGDAKWNFVMGETNTTIQTITSLMFQAAELYEDNGWSSPTSINLANSNNHYGWVTATTGEIFGSATVDINNATADQIIIGDPGLYEIDFSVSFSGTNNAQISTTLWHTPNGSSAYGTRIKSLQKLGAFGDLGSSSTHGLLRLGTGDIIDLRFNATSWGETIEIYNLNLIVNKVGD